MNKSTLKEPRGRRSYKNPPTPEEEYKKEFSNSSLLSTSKVSLDQFSDDDRSLTGSSESLNIEQNYSKDSSTNFSKSTSNFKLDQSQTSQRLQDRRTVDRSPERSKSLQREQRTPKQTKQSITSYIWGVVLLIAIILGLTLSNIATTKSEKLDPNDCSFKGIQTMFDQDIQDTVLVAIHEIEKFNKPSVITFLHQSGNQHEIDHKLKEILKYATCRLNGGMEYVEVTDADRTSPVILADPGKLITKYQRTLAAKNVMLVKHLENVHEDIMIKFHFICDEITTYVDRALIVFTIEHDENLAESDYNIVETVLMKNLKHTKSDFILPLLARITNAIIRL